MEQYTTNELKVIIENCTAWIEESKGKIQECKRWGASWANSSFAFEAEASLARWQKKKKAAQAELVRRSQYDDLI